MTTIGLTAAELERDIRIMLAYPLSVWEIADHLKLPEARVRRVGLGRGLLELPAPSAPPLQQGWRRANQGELRALLIAIVGEAGPAGIMSRDILAIFEARKIRVGPGSVYARLSELRMRGVFTYKDGRHPMGRSGAIYVLAPRRGRQ